MAGQGHPRVGRFTFETTTGSWEWDDEVFRIHGLAPGTVSPTTEYLLAREHPEDRARVAAVLTRAAGTGESLSAFHRLVAADGVERKVVLVCEGGMCDGPTTSVEGYFIDLTDEFRVESQEVAADAVAASAAHRAVIEQAKGSLMLVYGLDADQAFAMLAWWSRNKNVKIRDLAARLVETAQSGATSDVELRTAVDHLLHDLASPGAPEAGAEPEGSPAASGR